MRDINIFLAQKVANEATEVASHECKSCKKSWRFSRLRKMMMTFLTLVLIPTCQSMPLDISVTYIQNAQVINEVTMLVSQ